MNIAHYMKESIPPLHLTPHCKHIINSNYVISYFTIIAGLYHIILHSLEVYDVVRGSEHYETRIIAHCLL